jgi:hypothetical protein
MFQSRRKEWNQQLPNAYCMPGILHAVLTNTSWIFIYPYYSYRLFIFIIFIYNPYGLLYKVYLKDYYPHLDDKNQRLRKIYNVPDASTGAT